MSRIHLERDSRMNEYERRKQAIRRVAQGERISTVCGDLGRSRPWYYKWRDRYRQAGLDGLRDGRCNSTPPQSTPDKIQQLVIEMRDRLVRQAEAGTHYLGIGGNQIRQEFTALGLPAPSRSTIYRILKKAGRTRVHKEPLYRPRPPANQVNAVHQLDLWPRVLQGGTTLFLIHLVDVASWYPCGAVIENKGTDAILSFVLESWQHLGVPRVLQLDNEWSFTGGRWAHRLGRLVRLALLFGCEVWFNPFYTAEANSHVERFHGLCNQFFWSRRRFADPNEVAQKYPAFLQSFRQTYHPEQLDGQTPAQARQQLPHARQMNWATHMTWSSGRSLPLVDGRVHCVRRTDTQGNLKVLNRPFTLDFEHNPTYIRATVAVADQCVAFYYQEHPDEEPECIDVQKFPFSQEVEHWPLAHTFDYLS